MGATTETVTSAGVAGKWFTGTWTTESSKGDHTITFPNHLAYFQVVLNSSGTNPYIATKHISETDETILQLGTDTGTTAHVVSVIETPTDATGVTITNNATGTCTVLVDSNYQTNSGVNVYVAMAKG